MRARPRSGPTHFDRLAQGQARPGRPASPQGSRRRPGHAHPQERGLLNGDADHENPSNDLSIWTIERLQSFAEDAQGHQLEAVRVVAQSHAYRAGEPRETRQQWAKLSLQANQRLHGDSLWDRARATQQNFMLRMRVIDQLDRDDEDHDWSPETLANDTVTALALTPAEARALAVHWRDLAVEQIGELRRHKNLTAHLDRLVDHLQPSPVRDQLLVRTETRQHLP